MTTVAAVVQLIGFDSTGQTNVQIGAAYIVADDVALRAEPRNAIDVFLPINDRSVWKDLIVQGIIAEAATAGFTLTADKVFWLTLEPGDYKYSKQAANWPKDVTKTNLPTTYTNLYAGAAGEAQLVDFAGYKQYRFVVSANKVGTGTQTVALADVLNAANLIEIADAGVTGEKTLDSTWTDLPAWGVGEKILKPQAKSTVNTDDPVYRQVTLYLR